MIDEKELLSVLIEKRSKAHAKSLAEISNRDYWEGRRDGLNESISVTTEIEQGRCLDLS